MKKMLLICSAISLNSLASEVHYRIQPSNYTRTPSSHNTYQDNQTKHVMFLTDEDFANKIAQLQKASEQYSAQQEHNLVAKTSAHQKRRPLLTCIFSKKQKPTQQDVDSLAKDFIPDIQSKL